MRIKREKLPIVPGPRHLCGGETAVTHLSDGEHYVYCYKCAAFAFMSHELPTGTDVQANCAAWEAGERSSPAAQ